MRRDQLYLFDILEATEAVAKFTQGLDEAAFLSNELIKSAVLQKLTVIGEAASKISESVRTSHEDIPWSDIVAFRNIAVHAYFRVDWSIVWTTATKDVPHLRIRIAKIAKFDGSGGEP